jgi:hypothetical protein
MNCNVKRAALQRCWMLGIECGSGRSGLGFQCDASCAHDSTPCVRQPFQADLLRSTQQGSQPGEADVREPAQVGNDHGIKTPKGWPKS